SGSWSINIGSVTAGVVFNVNVSSVSAGVTFNVNVTGSVAIDVKTSGGANIVIDKLTQAAYTEDRRTLANNGATAEAVLGNLTYRKGKYFPRGCRGFIDTVWVYCDNSDTAAHTLTVYFCVQQGMAPVFSVPLSIAAGSGLGWRSVTVGRFWNYDSMFIYVRSDSDSYVRTGRDSGTPYDYYYSTDEVTWVAQSYRTWIYVSMAGLTVGDLPVSGIVNTVEVPSVSSAAASGEASIGAGASQTLLTLNGPGECQCLCFYSNHPDLIRWEIRCDGNTQHFMPMGSVYSFVLSWWLASYGDVGHGLAIMITKYDTTNNKYSAQIVMRLPFKLKLEVIAYNADTAASHVASVSASVRRLS
ncbi:MAG: hypothetical protein ACPLZY_02840, partial [Candidatus Norongarragalinales archaeon]